MLVRELNWETASFWSIAQRSTNRAIAPRTRKDFAANLRGSNLLHQSWAKCKYKGKAQPPKLRKLSCSFYCLFWNIAEVVLRTKVIKISCVLFALRFQNFFWLKAQFHTLNLILFHYDRNIDKCWPSLENYLLFFCLKSQKMRYLHCVVKFQLRKLGYPLTRFKNVILQLRNCVALHLNQKVYCGGCAALQNWKKIELHILRCAFTSWKDRCALLRCVFGVMLFVPTSALYHWQWWPLCKLNGGALFFTHYFNMFYLHLQLSATMHFINNKTRRPMQLQP